MRVEKIVRAAEELAGKTTKEERMHTIVIKQFASSLKAQKGYDEWTDDEITASHSTWTPPEMSKQAAAKAAAPAASADGDDAASASSASSASSAPKAKRQWSDEAKASAAAKRAAKKADAPDAPADAPAPAEAAAPAPAGAPTPSAKKAVVMKPKKAAAPAGAPTPTAKKVDLSFYSWTHDGKEYYTNDRGDVATTDFEWVGRFNGTIIDESVAEPADLGEATLRE
jgi:hypothetical protein